MNASSHDHSQFYEYVHLYVEGILPDYAETTLFAELSHNNDLRAELGEQIRTLSLAKNHAASIHAPSRSKNAIFAELGLALPENASSTIAVPILASPSSSGIGAIAQHPRSFAVAASVCSSLVTAFLMMLFMYPATQKARIDEAFEQLRMQKTFKGMSAHTAHTARTGSESTMRIHGKNSFHQAAQTGVFALPVNTGFSGADVAQTEASAQSVNMGFGSTDTLVCASKKTPNTSLNTRNDEPLGAFEHLYPETLSHAEEQALPALPVASRLELLPVRLTLRHVLAAGEVGVHFGVQYALTKEHTIGFEGGSESAAFFTRQAGTAGEGNRTNTSNDALFSGTAFYRYSFVGLAFPHTKQIVPFAQAGVGVVGRCGALQGLLGLRFDVLPELSFTVSAEAKVPVFYSENYFQSKTALSVGMQYHISDAD